MAWCWYISWPQILSLETHPNGFVCGQIDDFKIQWSLFILFLGTTNHWYIYIYLWFNSFSFQYQKEKLTSLNFGSAIFNQGTWPQLYLGKIFQNTTHSMHGLACPMTKPNECYVVDPIAAKNDWLEPPGFFGAKIEEFPNGFLWKNRQRFKIWHVFKTENWQSASNFKDTQISYKIFNLVCSSIYRSAQDCAQDQRRKGRIGDLAEGTTRRLPWSRGYPNSWMGDDGWMVISWKTRK